MNNRVNSRWNARLKIRRLTLVMIRAAILASAIIAGAASACEDDAPRRCSLDRACYGQGRQLCGDVARAFCAERRKRCLDATTLTMDPRDCVALLKRIHSAIRAQTGETGRHPEHTLR